jgi:cob(I)alamin adenosyltransferase
MKIYTKTGDSGSTSLCGGTRVAKNHPRVEAYGDVDELISYIGLLRCELVQDDALLRRIQECLMLGSAHLSSDGRRQLKNFDPCEIEYLEELIDQMTAQMPPQTAFVLPAAPRTASLCHVIRTVCRRAERSSIGIEDKNEEISLTIKYLNRLSDFFFTLARYQCFKNNISEDFWLP